MTILIIGLAILPSLYAWFNIASSWDPYSQTSSLSISVANLDTGTTLRGISINAGEEIISSLKENHSLGWRFTDEDAAVKGVRHGDDYAAIIIPKDFSARIGTVLSDEPSKAEILYYTNEKINAVAPKVTAKGASGIVEEVSKNFIHTANGAIFQIFNELGIELENELPTIKKVEDLVFRIESHFPDLNRAMETAIKDMQTANKLVLQSQESLPILEEIARNGQEAAGALAEFAQQAAEASVSLEPRIKQDLAALNEAALSVQQAIEWAEQTDVTPEEVKDRLTKAKEHAGKAAQVADRLSELFQKLDTAFPNSGAASAGTDLKIISERFVALQKGIEAAENAIDEDNNATEKIANLKQLAIDAANLSGGILSRYDREIGPKISAGLKQAGTKAQTVQKELNQALLAVPDVKKLLQDAKAGLAAGSKEASAVQSRLPEAEQQISKLADRFRKLEQGGELQEIISLLKNNFEQESQFFAEPVQLKENRLYPIPNYGSGMSPFFTTLSLWVGALLLVSLLSVEVHHDGTPSYRSIDVYFGRFLTFLTIAIFQAGFVTLGDIFILGTYVVNAFWFVVFAVIISSVFMLIVYTLVSVFGNVGKAMAIVLLVLQLAGAGGTFPIQMTPVFFQTLHPYLPFTYAISMMREAVGGILWDIVYRDLLILLVFTAIAMIIGIGLKGPINRGSNHLIRKARESKLIH